MRPPAVAGRARPWGALAVCGRAAESMASYPCQSGKLAEFSKQIPAALAALPGSALRTKVDGGLSGPSPPPGAARRFTWVLALLPD
jgi:hypothetical protein